MGGKKEVQMTMVLEDVQAELAAWRQAKRSLTDADDVEVRTALMRCTSGTLMSDL